MANARRQTKNSSLKNVKENPVMDAVKNFLELHQIPFWRINSGAYKTQKGNFVRYGAKGMSDIYAIGKDGVSIWIECKRPVGGRLSEPQANFLDCINRNGGIGIVVNSVVSLEQQLKEAGVI